MAIFEYPKTRYNEWQKFLSEGRFYPYYTIGSPPMPIEDLGGVRETWRRKAEEVVAKMRDQGIIDPERLVVIPKWDEVSGEQAVVVDYTLLATEERPEPVTDMDKKVDEMASDVLSGKATATHRGVLRKAIDQKEAPLTGRAKADAGLGRAIRFGVV